jgi:hypothetical protein
MTIPSRVKEVHLGGREVEDEAVRPHLQHGRGGRARCLTPVIPAPREDPDHRAQHPLLFHTETCTPVSSAGLFATGKSWTPTPVSTPPRWMNEPRGGVLLSSEKERVAERDLYASASTRLGLRPRLPGASSRALGSLSVPPTL